MNGAKSFAAQMEAVERVRPRFYGQRFTEEGSFPYPALLARASDAGGLEVLGEIHEHEMKEFLEWCALHWCPR